MNEKQIKEETEKEKIVIICDLCNKLYSTTSDLVCEIDICPSCLSDELTDYTG